MTRAPLCVALALFAACAMSACRNADQPEKKTPPAAKPAVQPAGGGKAAEPPAKPADAAPKKDDQTMQQAIAKSPLLTLRHTLTKPGKELAAADKLPSTLKAATFGAGCFWGVEDTFRALPGVIATSVGYSGGRTQSPTYKQVCYEGTGHAEVVDVVFDPSMISYEKLLSTFFSNHNPTQVNRQGPDYGDQYRTVIFYHDDAQKAAAEKAKDELAKSGKWSQPIATQIVKFDKFWPAEEYHQTYHEKNGGVCH